MKPDFIRFNLVHFGDLAGFGGVIVSLLAIVFRIFHIAAILGVQPMTYFVGGMWLMLLGALIRLETLLTVGKEELAHPELYGMAVNK